jgi:hypothetical protein
MQVTAVQRCALAKTAMQCLYLLFVLPASSFMATTRWPLPSLLGRLASSEGASASSSRESVARGQPVTPLQVQWITGSSLFSFYFHVCLLFCAGQNDGVLEA